MSSDEDSASGRAAGTGAVVLAATAFSWGFVIVKSLGLPAGTIAFWRLAIGASVLGILAASARLPWPVRFWPVLGAGICFGIHQLLFIAATQLTSIAIVTLLGALQPLVVALVSKQTVGERVPRALVLWAVVAIGGVAMVLTANLRDPSRSLLGDSLAALNLLAFTAFFLFSKRARLQGTHTVTLTASFLACALIVVAPALLFVSAAAPEARWQWGLLALLALGPGNGHLLVNWAHRRITAALASIVLAGVPLLASIWAHLVLDEPYGWPHVAGTLLVVAAVEGGRRAERRTRIPASD